MNKPGTPQGEVDIITILLVDDIADTRENIKKLLTFETDFKVVGSVGTGREGVTAAKELKPNIIIMDINMPDMDGIQATTLITESVPTAAVIMMSVQNDPDYLRRAMLAGARNFLTKPIMPDELYNTIRTVHARHKPIAQTIMMQQQAVRDLPVQKSSGSDDDRAGHIIVVYSPQGGVGCTTIATNIASGLMKEGIRVLLVDSDLQFGDVGVFLNLQSQSTMTDLVDNIEDLDTELFDNIVVTHDSGLKVLMGPSRPEFADVFQANPAAVSQILEKVKGNYDFIVVDTSRHLDDTLVSLLDVASKIVIVAMPTLASVKNVRFVLDLFDQLQYPADKTMLVLNRVPVDRNQQKFAISSEKIEKFLKRPVEGIIPTDEFTVLGAMSRGVPVIAHQRDRSKSPTKELMNLADLLYTRLMPQEEIEEKHADAAAKKTTSWGIRLGGKA
jgi:pilus assembly protein CpaE